MTEQCENCGSEDIEHEGYGIRCLDCGHVKEREDSE